jgi:hypothetical protein
MEFSCADILHLIIFISWSMDTPLSKQAHRFFLSRSLKVSRYPFPDIRYIDVSAAMFSTISGFVVHWTGRYRECLLVGWAIWAIGLGLLSTLDSPSLEKQIGYGLLAGLGLGGTLQPSLIAVQAGVERKHMAVVTSTRKFVRNLSSTLGLAISDTIINTAVRSRLKTFELSITEMYQLLDSPHVFRDSLGEQRTAMVRIALCFRSPERLQGNIYRRRSAECARFHCYLVPDATG